MLNMYLLFSVIVVLCEAWVSRGTRTRQSRWWSCQSQSVIIYFTVWWRTHLHCRCHSSTLPMTSAYVTLFCDYNNGWIGEVVIRASDLWSTGCEYDSRPCTAGSLGGWPSLGG